MTEGLMAPRTSTGRPCHSRSSAETIRGVGSPYSRIKRKASAIACSFNCTALSVGVPAKIRKRNVYGPSALAHSRPGAQNINRGTSEPIGTESAASHGAQTFHRSEFLPRRRARLLAGGRGRRRDPTTRTQKPRRVVCRFRQRGLGRASPETCSSVVLAPEHCFAEQSSSKRSRLATEHGGRVVSPSKALCPPHAIGIDHEANTEQLRNAGVHPRGVVCRAPAEHLHWRDTGKNRVGCR